MVRLALCTLALLPCAAVVSAAPILTQPLAVIDGRSSHVTGPSTGFVTYDKVQVAQDWLVDRITWTGAFIDATVVANNPVIGTADSWTFGVYADAAGVPGASLDSASVSFAAPTATYLGVTNLAGQPVYVYEYSVSLATPIYLPGGSPVWFSVYATSATADPRFGWFSGSGGDGVAKQLNLGDGTYGQYVDRALALEGTAAPVPEPSTLALLAMSAGTIILRRRSRR